MAFFGKNTRVDTPFDNYKERSKEPDGIHVGRSGAADFFLNSKSVIFLVGVILSLSMKCERLGECMMWAVVLLVMIMLWSVTVRFFVPHKNMMGNIVINFVYVVLFGLGYTFAIKYGVAYKSNLVPDEALRYNLQLVYDMHYLTPMALAFSAASRYEYERPDFGWIVVLPTGLGLGIMLATSLILDLFNITKGFVAILIASLLLMLVSGVLTVIKKHGVYFAPPPQYNIFTEVPVKKEYEFRRFVLSKALLMVSAISSVVICEILVFFSKRYNFDLRPFIPIVMALLLGGFTALIGLIPFIKEACTDSFDIRYYIRYYEYPAISALLSIPFSGSYPYFKLLMYIVIFCMSDAFITGLLVSFPRKVIFADRNKCTTGAPAMLLTVSLIVMVGTIFFVIY
ncbi:MAG: hypothetical protein J6U54_10370 [Clostridiales bacterium]|nr:hypothetical protein [Clostridiales bacterium]